MSFSGGGHSEDCLGSPRVTSVSGWRWNVFRLEAILKAALARLNNLQMLFSAGTET